jgi:hypothetical protein
MISSPRLQKLGTTDFGIAVGVSVAVLVLHRLVGAASGADGTFIKYGIAAQQHIYDTLPPIRQPDLSPLFSKLMCGPSVWFPVIIEWGYLRSNLYFYD